jgi:hypoxanthine-DNA glycosylase
MAPIQSFPPIATPAARVLILGTMPGRESLRARQYYAHPQNAFWRIVGELLGFEPALDYAARTDRVRTAGIAVWDVLRSCTRTGSLDAAIEAASAVPNDFGTFLAAHPQIRRICFNGATAEALFAKHVRPGLAAGAKIRYLRLPSTSPAHAGLPFSAKLQAWRAVLP